MSRPLEPPADLLDALQNLLEHRFNSRELLIRALTHPSFSNEYPKAPSNQRLEFLGDAVLGTVIAADLFERMPGRDEGALSRVRSFLVCEESLYERAMELQLGPCMLLGKGEKKSQGHKKASLLADAYEAVLAAVYLDAGFEAAQRVILAAFETSLNRVEKGTHSRDHKTSLQEMVQARGGDLRPVYAIIDTTGPPHARLFTAAVSVNEEVVGTGQGMSKKAAQQTAAKNAIDHWGTSA